MGSLVSPPRPATPPPSPENHPISKEPQVYASFRRRDHVSSNENISNWLECYTPSSNTWTHASAIPGLADNHVLKGFSMVSIRNIIFILGGRLCRKVLQGDEFVEEDVDVLSWVLSYNVVSNEWSNRAPLRTGRYDFACSVCDNKIYVAGGQSTLGSAKGISSAELYDPVLNTWTPLPNMNMLRHKCAGVTWRGKFHVIGGFAEIEDSGSGLGSCSGGQGAIERSSAEVYDTRSGRWGILVGMWQLDIPPNQIVSVDERLFSCGDCLNAWKGHIEVYDGEVNIWTEVDGSQRALSSPIFPSEANNNIEKWHPNTRLYHTMAPIGTHLYILSAYRMAGDLSRAMSRVHVYDTSKTSGAWRNFEPMEEEGLGERELCGHCCVVEL